MGYGGRGVFVLKEIVAVSWSGGKDSAFALYKLMKSNNFHVDYLFSTIIEGENRVSSHGVRETLLDQQAGNIGVPLRKVYLPTGCSNDLYQKRMSKQLLQFKEEGIQKMVFGDIFLEDVRAFRESMIMDQGMKALFPLWGMETNMIMAEFLAVGFKTVTTCVDSDVLSPSFLGRIIDEQFLKELPRTVDPCGENGEFHTFTYGGPLFNEELAFKLGDKVDEERFHYCDLLLDSPDG